MEIRQETGRGRSGTSKRSSRISRSRKSEEPSIASSLARKTAIAANVARLKTELEFADTEARRTTALKEYEDEFKRFKLTEELALAKAEMDAVIKTEVDESEDLPQEFDRNYVLENYLQTQALSVSNAGNTAVTDVGSTHEPLKEDSSNKVIPAVKDESESTPLKFNPVNETTCTPEQKPMLTTPKSLNPFAPEFEARGFPRSEEPEKVSQRLYYLEKYAAGQPKEAISGLLLLETAEAYERAKKILSDRFGNPFLIAEAYRKKINEWPNIPLNDGISLRKFSDFLIHCHTAMNSAKYLN